MGHIIAAIAACLFAAALTDWFFMGRLWHEHYLAHPEVWRKHEGGEGKAVMWACALNILAAGAFVRLCEHFMLTGVSNVKLALVLWFAGPLPLLLGNHLFFKLHPKITAAHCLGWLAKYLVFAALTHAIL